MAEGQGWGVILYRILYLEYRLPRFVTFPFPCRLPFPLSQVTASESEKSRIVPDQVAACFSVDLKHPQGAFLPVVSALVSRGTRTGPASSACIRSLIE
jgi:hypothetical protein